MIAVRIDPGCQQIMRQLGITESQVETTINERHCGLTDDAATRIAAVHWFTKDQIVMVESVVTSRRPEGDRVYFDEVSALLGDPAPPIPARWRNHDMEMWEIQEIVAGSFGCPLRFHSSQPYAAVYGGPWDGNPPAFKPGEAAGECLLLTTLDPVQHTAKLSWAFDLNRYLRWLSQQS